MKSAYSRISKEKIAVGILFLLLAVLGWRNITDLDVGIHLASGRWILENGRVPTTDPFTYTVSDHDYLAYHWLFQVGVYTLYRWFGEYALAFGRWLLLIIGFLCLVDILRIRNVSALAGSLCGLIAILASEWRFAIRPELISYVLLAATFWVLERQCHSKTAPLWLLPVIQLLWVNTHIYIFGWAVMVAYLIADWARARSVWTPLTRWTGAAFVVLFINPYHYRAVLYPLYLFTRMDPDNLFARHISELASPFQQSASPQFPFALPVQFGAYKLLLGAGVLSGLLHLRRRRWIDLWLLASFGILSTLAVRNLMLYAMIAIPSISSALTEIETWWIARQAQKQPAPDRQLASQDDRPAKHPGKKQRKRRKNKELSIRETAPTPAMPRWHVNALAIVWGIAAMLIVCVLSGSFYIGDRRADRFSSEICHSCLAIDAADWLAAHHLQGPGFNNLNIGATLLWRAPAYKVFIDGRNEVTGEEFFKTYLAASEPDQWESTWRQFKFEYVILAHRAAMSLTRTLFASPAWKMCYADDAGVIFVRAAGPNGNLPAVVLPQPVAEEARWTALQSIDVRAGWREKIRRWLWIDQPAPGPAFHFGTFLLMLGEWKAAEQPLLTAAQTSPDFYEVSNNLGSLYHRLQIPEAALLCYLNVLMLNPGDPLARQRASEAEQAYRKLWGFEP